MERRVIACYRPRAGQEEALLRTLARHVPALRDEGLVTGAAALVMRTQDGTILETFEWVSEEASREAHENETVRILWEEIEGCSEPATLGELAEAGRLFPHFDPVELP